MLREDLLGLEKLNGPILITGHTGFKGSWLTLLLKGLGAEVVGISLQPDGSQSLYIDGFIGEEVALEFFLDIRDRDALENAIKIARVDYVFHLAAQALVRESYRSPEDTIETNVMGTINVLKASQQLTDLKAQLIITTDKVYKNTGKTSGYVETEALGGQDPYSASKAMADIATQVWMSRVSRVPTAIARAGNVFGGGDWSEDRLIPDLIRSLSNNQKLELRFPNAIRPWQHIIDPLYGYLLLLIKLSKTL